MFFFYVSRAYIIVYRYMSNRPAKQGKKAKKSYIGNFSQLDVELPTVSYTYLQSQRTLNSIFYISKHRFLNKMLTNDSWCFFYYVEASLRYTRKRTF